MDQQLTRGKAEHPTRLESRLVAGDDDRGAGRGGLLEESLHDLRVLLVDRRQRFVGQDDARLACQRPRHRDALAFPGGHLAGEGLAPAAEPERVECFERAFADPRVRNTRVDQHQGEHQVLEGIQTRQQPLLLVDEGDVTANAAESAAPPPMQTSSLDPDLPACWPELTVDQAKQRGLAGAARTRDLDQLTGCNCEIDIGEDSSAAERLGQMGDTNGSCRRDSAVRGMFPRGAPIGRRFGRSRHAVVVRGAHAVRDHPTESHPFSRPD